MMKWQRRSIWRVALVAGLWMGLLWLAANAQAATTTPASNSPEWRGLVESRPAGIAGEWVIGGRTFRATNSTQIEQEQGVLAVGVCAEVKYRIEGSGNRAIKIESAESDECGADGGGDGGAIRKSYGLVESMPLSEDLIGAWRISGDEYVTSANTYFEQEHGGYAVGACVEVYAGTGTPAPISKVSTEKSYKCRRSDGGGTIPPTVPYGELYGLVNEFPPSLIGNWVVGGVSFVADNSTRFEQKRSSFAVNTLVEVKFYVGANGLNRATKIESKYRTDPGGDGNGVREGNEGHAYAVVEAMPASGLIGDWTLSGLLYKSDSRTRFKQEQGSLAVGSMVKVRYYLDGSQNRVARKIETTSKNGGVEVPGNFKLYGFVQSMPSTGFNGIWVINGAQFIADPNSLFDETQGLLAVGAYVEVEYTQEGADARIYKLETHVPPGAGAASLYGALSNVSGSVRSGSGAYNETWTIGGQAVTVTDATLLNDLGGEIEVGTWVLVNLTDTAGVATQIETVPNTIYLPLTQR